MGKIWQVEIPLVPPAELRGNSQVGYIIKYKYGQELKEVGRATLFQLRDEGMPLPVEKAKITYHFIKPKHGDIDNFAYGMKYFLDGLVMGNRIDRNDKEPGRVYLTLDDDPEHIVFGEHSIRRPKPEDEVDNFRVLGKTIIYIEPLEDSEPEPDVRTGYTIGEPR